MEVVSGPDDALDGVGGDEGGHSGEQPGGPLGEGGEETEDHDGLCAFDEGGVVIVVSSPVVDGASALLFQDGCEID